MTKIKKWFKRWWLVFALPILTISIPAIYLTGIDLALPSRAATPEARVESFVKKADRNRRRTETINAMPFGLADELSDTYELRNFFVFRSSGFPYVLESPHQNHLDGCDSVYHFSALEKFHQNPISTSSTYSRKSEVAGN